MGTKTALKAAFQRKTLEGQIKGLAARLYTLAPDPVHKRSGPLFIHLRSEFKPAAEYDGMLGSMLLGAMMGAGLQDLPLNDNNAFNNSLNTICNISEYLSEYYKDREEAQDIAEKGQGSFALGEHTTICNQFNDTAGAYEAYQSDLPARLRLEANLRDLVGKLDLAIAAAPREPQALAAA